MVRTPITADRAQSLETEFFGSDVREQSVITNLRSLMAGHKRFIDAGANIGQYSFLANECLRNADIVSIEANPDLIELMKSTLRRANAERANNNIFEVINCAISDTKGKLKFYIDASTLTTSSIFGREARNSEGRSVEVECIPLDDLFIPGVKTFIKMDIEGAEYRAILGGSRFWSQQIRRF